MDSSQFEDNVQVCIKSIKNRLTNADSKDDILKLLTALKNLLLVPSEKLSISSCQQYFSNCELQEGVDFVTLQNKILSSHIYTQRLYNLLIENISVDWMSILTLENFNKYIKFLFLHGPADDSFLTLIQAIESKKNNFCFQTCVSFLEELITVDKLTEILHRQCQVKPDVQSNATEVHYEQLVTSLCSLPEKMANRLQHENSEKFYPGQFYPMLSVSLLQTFEHCHNALAGGRDFSLQMVSALVGKLCLTGSADIILDKVLPYCCSKVRTNFIWSRICTRVFTGVPSRCLEAVLTPLLRKIQWYGLVEKFLGDCVIQNSAARMLICTKILFHKNFECPKQLLQNIIGYLSKSETRHHLYLEVFVRLLEVWGSHTSMRHISARQHLYISQALVVCLGVLEDRDVILKKDELLSLLMPGVQAHLESSDPQVRLLGMIVAKRLTQRLDKSGPQLEFELDLNNSLVQDLLGFEQLPDDPGTDTVEIDSLISKDDSLKKGKPHTDSSELPQDSHQHSEDSELDSDDDLVPYDMSNDTKVTSCKPPKYIRECMEGLISSSENLDRAELCLKHAESIIRKKTSGLEEISAEFAKILLHLTDLGGLDNSAHLRRKSMCALLVTCPVQVADYLTSQFYERNYNLRQRMDILDALADGAMELSQIEKPVKQDKKSLIQDLSPKTEEPANWKEVVQRRIESNTRRFAKGERQPPAVVQLSRFAPVAGHFFYPLLVKVDQREPCLDLIGQDSAILCRLLYTLSIVVHCATNAPTASQMGRTLLEFTWSLRTHSDQCVRQAVLTATTTVFLSVPAHAVMSDLHADVSETCAWLEDVIEKDSDTECQKQAAQALLILQEKGKKA